MSYVNWKGMAAAPVRLATWALLAIAAAAFAFGLALSSPLAAMADEGGLAAAPLTTQDDHGAVKYGPYEVGSPNAADVTATIYDDGTMVIDGTGDVVNVTSAATWRGLLGWSPSSGTGATEQMLAIRRVEFGDDVAPTSLNRWFYNCANLESFNRIPSSTTDLRYTFNGCSSLVELPAGFAIPQGASTSRMFNVSEPYAVWNPLVTYCNPDDYEALVDAYDWSSSARVLAVPHDPFDVTCTLGANAAATDAGLLSQTGVTTVMKLVTVAPAEGYKLAAPTIAPADAGVSVSGDQYTGWTLSGTPTANVTVVFADAIPAESVVLYSEKGASLFNPGILNPSVVLREAKASAVYQGPCEDPYDVGYSYYVVLDPATPSDATVLLQASGTSQKSGHNVQFYGNGQYSLSNGTLDKDVTISLVSQSSYSQDGNKIRISVHIVPPASEPTYTPVVASSDESVGKVEATFVANSGSKSVWQLKANVINDWCEFDKFVDENGKTYEADDNLSALVKVGQDGLKITGRFKSKIDPLYDETDAESVRVKFTISNDGVPLAGNDGNSTPLAYVEEEIPYFDLSLYGLERYNRYHTNYGWGEYSDDVLVKRPTALHAYIWLLERYYLGLDASECGKGTSNIESYQGDTDVYYFDGEKAYRSGRARAILPSGPATELFLSQFWGHGQNLMYFVNHAYPMMSPGKGATCDYILLADGDTIDVGLFSLEGFQNSGGFCQFDQNAYEIDEGDELSVHTLQSATREASEGEPQGASEISTLNVAVYDSKWNKVADLEGAGSYSHGFADPGTYYLIGVDPSAKDPRAACFAPAVARVEVADVPDRDEDGNFLLATAEDMAWLQDYVNVKGHRDAKAALVADVDMSSLEWTGLGDDEGLSPDGSSWNIPEGVPADKAFSGVLDGRGHTLTVAFGSEPLVTVLSGTVKDLSVEGTCAAAAAFAKIVTYGATIEGCANAADVTGSAETRNGQASGGIAAVAAHARNVSPASADDAIVIRNCTNRGAVVSDAQYNRYVGGVLGMVANQVVTQQPWGTLLAVSGCSNEGDVLAARPFGYGHPSSLGGIVGAVSAPDGIAIADCSNSGRVDGGNDSSSGGILGSYGNSETSYAMIVSRCQNTGDIAGTASFAGGIAGRLEKYASLVEQCSNAGDVNGQNSVGGIAGRSSAEISYCYNRGSVTCSSEGGGAGGIAGVQIDWQIPNTYDYVGAPITGCYTTGAVAGGANSGAVVGALHACETKAFWLEGAAASAVGTYAGAYSDQDKTEMKTAVEMRYDALVGELGEAFQASCPYPVFTWQEAADHTWDEGTVTVEPTIGAEGEMSFECTVCGETKTEVLPKADTSEIQAAIEAANAIDASALTDEQKAGLEAAIAAAVAAAGDEGTTASQLDAAFIALELQAAKADAAIARAEAAAAQQAAIDAAQSACAAAGIDYDSNKSPAENVAAANAAQKAKVDEANAAAEEAAKSACAAAGIDYDPTKSPADNVAAANKAQQAKVAQAVKAAEAAEAKAAAAESKAKAVEKAASSGLKANPMKATGKKVKAKAKKLKKKAKTAPAVSVTGAKGQVSYKLVKVKAKKKKLTKQAKKKIKLAPGGKLKLKKGLKKGTYTVTVQVKAAGDTSYDAATQTVAVKVKVK